MNLAASLSELSEHISEHREFLMRAAAGLQLCPENATKWVRFERLLEVSSRSKHGLHQKTISSRELRRLLSRPPIAVPGEDPPEEPFVIPVILNMREFRTITGGSTHAARGCQLVLDAVSELPPEFAEFQAKTLQEAELLLELSEAICARAELPRFTSPESDPEAPLKVPTDSELARLLEAVTFRDSQLTELVGPAASLASLYYDETQRETANDVVDELTDAWRYVYPLDRISDSRTVVGLPNGLARSISHRTLIDACDRGLQKTIVDAVVTIAQRAIGQSLHRMSWLPIESTIVPPANLHEQFWLFDRDKIAHVVCVVDSLSGYSENNPFGMMDGANVQQALSKRFGEVRSAVSERTDIEGVLHLAVTAPLGRGLVFGLDQPDGTENFPVLAPNIDNLDLVSRSLAGDSLGLWKFARASNKLGSESKVLAFSVIDEFSYYKENRSSFYFSDDRRPSFVSISPGTGLELALKTPKRFDPHLATTPSGETLRMERLNSEETDTIYHAAATAARGCQLVRLDMDCWIVQHDESEDCGWLINSLAFWMWRCRTILAPALARLIEQGAPHLEFRVWSDVNFQRLPKYTDEAKPWIEFESADESWSFDLRISQNGIKALRGATNEGELAIIRTVIDEIYNLATLNERRTIDSLEVDPKAKTVNVFVGSENEIARFGETPKPRLIQDADLSFIADEIGVYLRLDKGDLPRSLPADERTSTLNKLVSRLFAQLKEELARLHGGELIERLLIEQERCAYLDFHTDLTSPTRIACYGRSSAAVNEASEARERLTRTGPPLRFLLEMATALQVNGTQSLSDATYDRLLALGHEIVQLGMLSDACRYRLSDAQLSVLPSGRLGVSRHDTFETTLKSFASGLPAKHLDRATKAFVENWPSIENQREDVLDDLEVDVAYASEFGVSATQLVEVIETLAGWAAGSPNQILERERHSLIDELEGELTLTKNEVEVALDLLTLSRMSAFPGPENPADSFPWKFSRNRSSARRPIAEVTNPNGTSSVLIGPRTVIRAGEYLYNQIVAGRLDADSDPMNEFVSRRRRAKTDAFNRFVADLYRPDYIVRENVKKLGSRRLERTHGQDIGDIDVLVADFSKRVILAVETKDFAVARTPSELRNEVDKLLEGEKSALAHHIERLNFLRDHAGELLDVLNLDNSAPGPAWQIQGLIVTSTDLVGRHYAEVAKTVRGMKFATATEVAELPQDKRLQRTRQNRNTKKSRKKRRRR